jgi:acyl-coenzyme A thioesterase PaaI-like protein
MPLQPKPEEAQAFDRTITALRGFLDRIAGARPDAATMAALTQDLDAWSERLEGFAVGDHEQLFGRLVMQPGRGQTMSPKMQIERLGAEGVTARVTYGRYFTGVGGAVHGGAIALLFDEVLGIAASMPDRPRIRTAYLNVAFKALTPVEAELTAHGWLDREEGRKLFVRGELRHGDTVCAEAEGLFVRLQPHQG